MLLYEMNNLNPLLLLQFKLLELLLLLLLLQLP
jgi:hypothetical protein